MIKEIMPRDLASGLFHQKALSQHLKPALRFFVFIAMLVVAKN
jgi:hypothetical protein